MILFTSERIDGKQLADPAAPFQPGEVYVVRYMTVPTVVTVTARTHSSVSVWFATMDTEAFNERVLFKLGKRARFLGVWMPFLKVDPRRVSPLGLQAALGGDQAFWDCRTN